jgi:hypothetical protein
MRFGEDTAQAEQDTGDEAGEASFRGDELATLRYRFLNDNFLHDYPSFILTAPLILFMIRRL